MDIPVLNLSKIGTPPLTEPTKITFFWETDHKKWFAYAAGRIWVCADDLASEYLLESEYVSGISVAVANGERYYFEVSGKELVLINPTAGGSATASSTGAMSHYGGKPQN